MTHKLHPHCKLWISSEDNEGVFGDGKWRLLKAIEEKGSLKKAAESLGISYRKAWGDIKKAETGLGVTFLEKTRGGSHGGHSVLTPVARQWIEMYDAFRTDLEARLNESFHTIFSSIENN